MSTERSFMTSSINQNPLIHSNDFILFNKLLNIHKQVSASGFQQVSENTFVRVLTLAGGELLCCASFDCPLSSGKVGMVDSVKHVELQCGLTGPCTAENICFKLAWRHKRWEALWSAGCVRCQKYKSNPFKTLCSNTLQ